MNDPWRSFLPAGVVAMVVSVLAPAPAQHASHDLVQDDLFVAGKGEAHTYRIPAIIATPSGALLAFAEARRTGSGDAGDIDLVMRRSDDDGATWSPIVVIGDNGPHTFGNPCPVVDRTTGTIWLFSTHNRGDDHERDIIAGTSRASRTVWVMTSTDDGRTWSPATEVTSRVKRSDWTWYATGPGIGIQTRSGRLVIPANHAVAGTAIHRSHILYSDDHGATWQVGGISVAGTNESQVVELADGRLMLNMRNHPPKPPNHRVVALSTDGGVTLQPPTWDDELPEPPAQASLVRYSAGGAGDRSRLLFSNPSGRGRERMTVRLSHDEGETWPVWRVIHEGPSAYSSLVRLRDGRIGLLYERGQRSPYERITWARFGLRWLTQEEDR